MVLSVWLKMEGRMQMHAGNVTAYRTILKRFLLKSYYLMIEVQISINGIIFKILNYNGEKLLLRAPGSFLNSNMVAI